MVLTVLGVLDLLKKAFGRLSHIELTWYILVSVILSLLELVANLLRFKVNRCGTTLTLYIYSFHRIEGFRRDTRLL